MLEMLTIEPPVSCSCITALARWLNQSGPVRLMAITDAWKRGEVGPVGATGEPPALLMRTSRRPNASSVRATTVVDVVDVADVARHVDDAPGDVGHALGGRRRVVLAP